MVISPGTCMKKRMVFIWFCSLVHVWRKRWFPYDSVPWYMYEQRTGLPWFCLLVLLLHTCPQSPVRTPGPYVSEPTSQVFGRVYNCFKKQTLETAKFSCYRRMLEQVGNDCQLLQVLAEFASFCKFYYIILRDTCKSKMRLAVGSAEKKIKYRLCILITGRILSFCI